MAKKKNWFDRLKRFFGSDNKSKQEKKERRRRWLFGRLKSKLTTRLPAPHLSGPKSLSDAEEAQNKQVMAVAVATATAAEAAIAAAQAAAQVVRLRGSTILSNYRSRGVAAVKIQTAFRGYLARKALQALRGLVKFQAVIRGQAVRRQMAITLRSLQSVMKIQSEARTTRVRMVEDRQTCEDKNIVHGKAKSSRDTRIMLNGDKSWNNSILSRAEMDAMLISKLEAAFRRERAMEYAAYQERRNLRRPTTPTFVLNHRWSSMDEWVGSQQLDKDIPLNPAPSPDENLDETELKFLERRRSFNGSRQSSPWDDDSVRSFPLLPSYMSTTESAKARLRSMSTPKQRVGVRDSWSECCSPSTNRLLSPLPSIVSEAGRSPTFRRRLSPCSRGRIGPVKSRRPSKYLSLDSECSLLNWDRHLAIASERKTVC